MRKPPFQTYLYGNALVLTVLFLGTLYLGYEAFIGEVSWVVPLIGFFLTGGSYQASEQITAYRLWELEWNAMAGIAPRQFQLPNSPVLRLILAIALIAGINYATTLVTSLTGAQVVAYDLLALLAIALLQAIRFGVRRLFRKRPKSVEQMHVALCLPPPRQAAPVEQAFAQLPEYCLELLAREYSRRRGIAN